MKRYYWLLGICLSLGVSFIAAFPRLLRSEVIEWPSFINSVIYTELFSLICWFGHILLMNSKKLYNLFPNKFWYGLLSIVSIGSLAYFYNIFFSETVSEAMQLKNVPPGKKLIVVILRGLIISGFYYFIIYSLKVSDEKQKHKIEIEQLKQAQLKANLASLKEQISPHFLFNTLNTLSTLTHEVTVKNFVSELANVYRYVLSYKDENAATVKQELNFIESYLYIVKTRLEDSIQITLQVDKHIFNTQIPPMTLQILIENAIKHNIAARYRPLRINIFNTDHELIIQNNLQLKHSTPPSTGTGLDNIVQRYQLIFGKDIEIEQNTDSFSVKLPIINA